MFVRAAGVPVEAIVIRALADPDFGSGTQTVNLPFCRGSPSAPGYVPK